MNITELDSYNLADAVKFNDQLNPRLWDRSEHLLPEVRERLLEIADDFRETLGVSDLELKDITISGSNAAYTYTPNSDIDLHLVVDLPEADRNEVYRELFDAKKYQYNDEHNIRIGDADVELYVENANQPPKSQGIYSILRNEWIQVPRRGRANIDDNSTKNKYETLSRQIKAAIKSADASRLTRLIAKIKKMRQTGLENHGEFGPENLAYKMLRSQGAIDELYTARNRARDQELSLAEQKPKQPFVYGFKKVQEASSPDGVSPETKMFLSEEPPADDEGVLQDFVDFCAAELKLEQVPSIRLRRDPQWSVRNRTFGRYTNDQHMLEVAWGNRHIMDVLRTVAHELTHKRQHERDGDRMGPDAGETGSPYENEANARAGILMRDYGRLHPELFDAGTANEELDESLRSRTAAAAVVAALLGHPTGAMAQSIQGILGFIRDAGTVVQQAQNITRAGLNAEVQQEIVNYVRGVGGDAGSQNLSQLYQLQRQLQQQEPQQQDQQYRQPQNESASGYIPTKKQAKDPRYSMALSVDIKPGQVGKEANKLKLQTDRQGHPKIANPNGLVEALMLELKQFQTLDEVRMAPRDLKRFAASPEAKGIRAGFEAELVFTGMGEESYDDLEPDYGADERAYSIQQVLDFFQNDEGYGISDRTAKRVEEQLDDMWLEWRDEQMMQDFKQDREDLLSDLWLEERPMTDRIHDALVDGMELTDDEADAVIILHARRERGEIKGSDMTDEQLDQAAQYSEARSIATDILADDVQGSIEKQDRFYDAALEDYSGNYSGDDDSFFSDVGLRYMSDVAEHFTLEWPYMTGGGGGEGGWSESNADHLADSLAKALGVKVKVSGGYHNATRDDTSWIIEPDSSLESDESDNMTAEIVSPPMPLDECLTKMEEFFAWAESEGAYANSSTGFHMGVSLPTKFHEDVDFTKLALFLGDEYVLREFGREANTYCRSAMEKIRSRLGSDSGSAVSGALDLMKNNLIELAHRSIANNMGFGKYTSINPKGNYIEFRSAGNSNYFEDVDKLKNTLLRYARAMSIAGNPSAERNEYAKKLYKLLAPAQQDPAMALFSRFSAGELSGKELKSQWAELSLMKERPKPGEEREWEAVDTHTDEVLGTVKDFSATNATNYFRDTLGNAYKFRVREKEPEPTSARAKLAKRIKTPKEKDDQQDSENLQARVSADVANVPRRWEFYRAETGAVIDTVDDINMMQANAVRADIVRRYGHPDESVRMRSVPTEQSAERARANMDRSSGSLLQGAVRAQDNMDAFERNSDRIDAIRAQARLGQARPAFGDVSDVEPDVAQNFPTGTQRNIGGSLAWELYNRETGDVVRTFWQPNEAEASRYAQEYVRDLSIPGSYSIRPQMATNESQDIQEGQFATLEQLKQYFRKMGRSEAEAAAAWQRGYRGRATPAVPRTPAVKHWQDINEDAMMGKIESTGKIVRIIRKQHSVKFSDQKDWLLIDTDPEKGDKGAGLKWVPASTRFEWVRPYRETVDEGIFGFGQQKPKLSQTFLDAFYAWQSNGSNLAEVEQAAVTILNDPASKPYRTPSGNIKTIYRTIGDINKTNTARNRVAIAYATNLAGAEYYFRHGSKNNKDFHVVQKQFSSQDFLLDFAAMCKGLGLTNAQYQKEHEIWMRPTKYYASYNADELVDRRGWIQKMTGNTQHPTIQAKAQADIKNAQQEKELNDLLEWARPYRETVDEGYYQVPDNNIFPDGNLFLTGHAKNDRFPERDITTDRVINLCRQAGKQYPNKLANLGDTGLVIQDPDEFGVGLIKQELPNGRYRYIVKTARDNLRTGVEQPVFKVIDEDYGPNDPPPGPESKPTMPAGTVKVDVSDVYDWYKLGQHISNLKGLGKHDFGKGPPSTIISFGSEEEEHKYIKDLEKTGLTTTDIDPVDRNQPPGMPRQKVDPTYNVDENFADGKGPGRPGDSQRHGIPKGATMAQLEKAAKAPGRKGQLARWQINMRRGKKK